MSRVAETTVSERCTMRNTVMSDLRDTVIGVAVATMVTLVTEMVSTVIGSTVVNYFCDYGTGVASMTSVTTMTSDAVT